MTTTPLRDNNEQTLAVPDDPKARGVSRILITEDEIRREIEEGREWERSEVDREQARRYFEQEQEPYKVELVDAAEGDISFYKQGDFVDLCRGPHLQNSKPIKAVKLLSLAGARVHLYGKAPRAGRKVGHVTLLDPADEEVDRAIALADRTAASA